MSKKLKSCWSNLLLPAPAKGEAFAALLPDAPAPLPPVVIDPKKFRLSKFKYHPDMSEETNAFSADIFWNNKKVGYARNDGHGGCTCIDPYPDMRKQLGEAEAWVPTLPTVSCWNNALKTIIYGDTSYHKKAADPRRELWFYSSKLENLEDLIDHMVDDMINKRTAKNCFVRGPHVNEPPIGVRYRVKCSPELQQMAEKNFGWQISYESINALPFHYYPAPHDFGSGWGRKFLLDGEHGGRICMRTTDELIVFDIGGTNEGRIELSPREAERRLSPEKPCLV